MASTVDNGQSGSRDRKRLMGRVEAWYAQRVGRALVRLGRWALKRGDVHEYRHASAAVKAGNSESCQPFACHLDPKPNQTLLISEALGLMWAQCPSRRAEIDALCRESSFGVTVDV